MHVLATGTHPGQLRGSVLRARTAISALWCFRLGRKRLPPRCYLDEITAAKARADKMSAASPWQLDPDDLAANAQSPYGFTAHIPT